jgi:hypothetical protein
MLVFAPRGETSGYASWYGPLWLDEPITLRAFHSLLRMRRFFRVAIDSTLLGLLKERAQDQQEVTDQLGYREIGPAACWLQQVTRKGWIVSFRYSSSWRRRSRNVGAVRRSGRNRPGAQERSTRLPRKPGIQEPGAC